MNDLERMIFRACREADEAFEAAGDAGTKCWIRDYFLPALERHDLEIRHRGEAAERAAKEKFEE